MTVLNSVIWADSNKLSSFFDKDSTCSFTIKNLALISGEEINLTLLGEMLSSADNLKELNVDTNESISEFLTFLLLPSLSGL